MESVFTFPRGSSGRRRTPSSSFSSCSSSLLEHLSSPLSPATPLRPISSGVPFSWEKLPGIPKKQTPQKLKKDSSLTLPLPPSKHRHMFRGNGNKKMVKNRQEDPFFAALVECSKQDQDQESNVFWSDKVSRTYLSYVFGFSNAYTCCKNTCAVSESIVYLPRSARSASTHSLPKS